MLYEMYSIATQRYKVELWKQKKKLEASYPNCECINIKNGNWWSYGFIVFMSNPDHYASHKFVTVYWKNMFEKFSSPGNQKKICKKSLLEN